MNIKDYMKNNINNMNMNNSLDKYLFKFNDQNVI